MTQKKMGLFVTLVACLLSQASLAVIPPLSQHDREELSSDIATGYVISVKKNVKSLHEGYSNAHFTVQMVVSKVDKGSTIAPGQTLSFGFWRSQKRPDGWCGDSGQYKTVKHYTNVKAYLNFDPQTKTYSLLGPNGFDVVND